VACGEWVGQHWYRVYVSLQYITLWKFKERLNDPEEVKRKCDKLEELNEYQTL